MPNVAAPPAAAAADDDLAEGSRSTTVVGRLGVGAMGLSRTMSSGLEAGGNAVTRVAKRTATATAEAVRTASGTAQDVVCTPAFWRRSTASK